MTAWDELLRTLDTWLISDVPADAESQVLPLVEQAQIDRFIDAELHPADVARWVAGLALGHAALRDRHPTVDADLEHADLLLILTRWLHPARPRGSAS